MKKKVVARKKSSTAKVKSSKSNSKASSKKGSIKVVAKSVAKSTSKVKPTATVYSPDQIYNMIQLKAFELCCKRGNNPGDAMQDWVKAEMLVKKSLKLA